MVAVVFGEFVLDTGTRQLRRGAEERHLEPKAFLLLRLLLARRPEAVTKSEIQEFLWPDAYVSESSLTGLVAQVRRALGDDRRRERFVRTVHGVGYAFCGAAREEGPAGPAPARLIWEGRSMPLHPGPNVLGRAEEVEVFLDLPGISRRHARLVVTGGGATIADLGSKNGTRVRDVPVTAETPLADGDTFRLGRHLFVFRLSRAAEATETEGPRAVLTPTS